MPKWIVVDVVVFEAVVYAWGGCGRRGRGLVHALIDLSCASDTDRLHLVIWQDLLKPFGQLVDHEFFRSNISGSPRTGLCCLFVV